MKSVIKPLTKSILLPLEVTATESATYADIYKKIQETEQMVEISGMSATSLDVSLLGSILVGRGVLRAGERTNRAKHDF